MVTTVSAGARPCKPNPNGKPWDTKVVYILFEGCASAEPDKPFDVTLGDETVRFKKEPATGEFWRGETKKFMAIGSRPLTVDLIDMRARTACNVTAEPYDAGSCVALYRISCEELWMLSVATVPPDAPAKIRYERSPTPPAFATCSDELLTPEGPGEIELGRNESIVVKVENLPNGPINVPLSLRTFGRRSKLTLRDVAPHAISNNSAVSTNRAMKALKKGQIQLVLKDLLFTKTN